MGKFIDFDTYEYSRDMVPEHSQESIENYLIRGWCPGGFIEAMFAGDLYRAATTGDQANGPAMQGIANWIVHSAPHGSWGSYENIKKWTKNESGCRTRYADKMEKEFIVRTLKE